MPTPGRIRILVLLALTTVGVACGGSALRTRGKDAAPDGRPDLAPTAADAADTTVDKAVDRAADADAASADAPRDSVVDDAVPADAQDARADADASADARDVSVEVLLADGRDGADTMTIDSRSDGDTADLALPDRPGEDGGVDLPTAIDTATGSLELVAGGLGGAGTQDGTGAAARFCQPTGMFFDGRGSLFVVDQCNHVIRQVVVATGEVSTLVGTAQEAGWADDVGPAARFAAPMGIAGDGQGNLYVTDSGTHLIRKIVIATRTVTTLAGLVAESGSVDGVGNRARFDGPWGIVYDGAGALYITDTGAHTVRKLELATAAVTTIAGSADERGRRDGIGSSAQFSAPKGIALAEPGTLLVADTDNRALRRLVLATGEVSTIDDRTFESPTALVGDGNGTYYVVDATAMTLRRFELATGASSIVAGETQYAGAEDGQGSAAHFYAPTGVVLDGAGNAYVADSYNYEIRKVALADARVTTLAGKAAEGGRVDGTGAQARFMFSGMVGMVGDGQGHLFVADPFNNAIRKIVLQTGEVSTFAGTPGDCDSRDGIGKDARFCFPTGLASDGSGNVFVADSFSHQIRKIVLATAAVSTVAGRHNEIGSDDGNAAQALFYQPTGIAADAAGNVYVADTENGTLRKLALASAQVTTLAGAAGYCAADDGVGTRARFCRPTGLIFDGASALLVADTGNGTIRRVSLGTGVVTTIAGTPGGNGNLDGVGADASFSGSCGLALDGLGNLFVADESNRSVRKVALATNTVTTVVGSAHRLGVVLGPLPASLSGPLGLAFVAPGTLFIADSENVVLRARF
jgi:hypothetical protein